LKGCLCLSWLNCPKRSKKSLSTSKQWALLKQIQAMENHMLKLQNSEAVPRKFSKLRRLSYILRQIRLKIYRKSSKAMVSPNQGFT